VPPVTVPPDMFIYILILLFVPYEPDMFIRRIFLFRFALLAIHHATLAFDSCHTPPYFVMLLPCHASTDGVIDALPPFVGAPLLFAGGAISAEVYAMLSAGAAIARAMMLAALCCCLREVFAPVERVTTACSPCLPRHVHSARPP